MYNQKQASLKQCIRSCNKYVSLFSLSSDEGACTQREQLDRRRLEEAHMKFCLLDVYKQYPLTFCTWVIRTNLQQTLDKITPLYYSSFSDRYAGTYYVVDK